VKADRGVEVVVVAVGGVHGLRAAHLLGRLAEELDGAGQPMALHRRLGREHTGERAHAERGVRIGVPRRRAVKAVARLA
jgi:hypothetical protein